MIHVEKQTKGAGGIYIIVNIAGAKAYVGRSNDLSTRTHAYDLKSGRDSNAELSKDYYDGADYIYFALMVEPIGENNQTALKNYEALYMTMVEDYGGFALYNSDRNPKKENRNWDVLSRKMTFKRKDSPSFDKLKEEFDEKFKRRFGKTMRELTNAAPPDRRKAYEEYLGKKDSIVREVFYFRKDELVEKYNVRLYSIKELNLGRMIVTSAGTYLKETIGEILDYEIKATQDPDYGYCLWTFGKKINTQFGRAFCKDWCDKTGEDIFLLIRYTNSGNNSDGINYRHFNPDDFYTLSLAEQELLLGTNSTPEDRAVLRIPERIDSTGTNSATHGFVIGELGIIKEGFDFDQFKQQFNCVVKSPKKDFKLGKAPGRQGGFLTDAAMTLAGKQHDTSCMQLKEGATLESMPCEEKDTTDYIIARLKAPYIVDITE